MPQLMTTSTVKNSTKYNSIPTAWREGAVFGALWGAGEITLGSFLTSLRIPMTGVIMACFGVIILTSGQMLINRKWFPLRTALVCAGLRSLSPGGLIFGPMFAILLQGTLVSLAFIIFRHPAIAGAVSGFAVTIASLLQGLVVKLIVYGLQLWELYLSLLDKAERLLNLKAGNGWITIGIFLLIIALCGSIAGLAGWRLGKAALKRDKSIHAV